VQHLKSEAIEEKRLAAACQNGSGTRHRPPKLHDEYLS
jgi:hypothetical protein